ncbi:hypothetical protein KFK09_004906 [Dendrobium nobile]|uniref:DUF4283 domain-containing protein n=1 Tax=Dendrobium nobile TaxID=94219 RepID=A0A8T3BUD0_DENNO|nr:hypothetical protein KFK09_004906 [Dendrobium nobile]
MSSARVFSLRHETHFAALLVPSDDASSFKEVICLFHFVHSLSFCAFSCLLFSMAGKRLVDAGFLEGKTTSKSFHDVLSSNVSSFPDLKITTHRGLLSSWISEDKILSLATSFDFALVEKFPTHWPSLEAIQFFFFNFQLIGDFSVTVLNPKHVLIKLLNDLDYCRIFSHRSYFINNFYM